MRQRHEGWVRIPKIKRQMHKDMWIKMQLTNEFINMTQVEVAQALNLDRKTVAEAEKSGVEKIRKAFEERGIDVKKLLGD